MKKEKINLLFMILLGALCVTLAFTNQSIVDLRQELKGITEYGEDAYFMVYQNGQEVMDKVKLTGQLPDNFKDLKMSKRLSEQMQVYVISQGALNKMVQTGKDTVYIPTGYFWRTGPGAKLQYVSNDKR